MAESKQQLIMDAIRAEYAGFEASRQRLLAYLDANNGVYTALGGNTFTNPWLAINAADGSLPTWDMTQAEWVAFWPTLRTAVTISQANLGALAKGLLRYPY